MLEAVIDDDGHYNVQVAIKPIILVILDELVIDEYARCDIAGRIIEDGTP